MKRTFVCASSRIKHYVQPFIRLPWEACSRPYVCLYFTKKLLNKLQKCTGTRTKNIQKMKDAAAKKSIYKVQSMDDNCGEWLECMGVASWCG